MLYNNRIKLFFIFITSALISFSFNNFCNTNVRKSIAKLKLYDLGHQVKKRINENFDALARHKNKVRDTFYQYKTKWHSKRLPYTIEKIQTTILNEGSWTSPAGLIYGPDKAMDLRKGSKNNTRIDHVLQHTIADPTKPKHSVFLAKGEEILHLIDDAWSRKGSPLPDDPYAYVIKFKKPIGTEGETALKIIVQPGTSKLITAFPIKEKND